MKGLVQIKTYSVVHKHLIVVKAVSKWKSIRDILFHIEGRCNITVENQLVITQRWIGMRAVLTERFLLFSPKFYTGDEGMSWHQQNRVSENKMTVTRIRESTFYWVLMRGNPPQNQNLLIKNCEFILTCLNFSCLQSILLMPYTYRDFFSTSQNSFWTHQFWCLLVLLLFLFCFVSSLPHWQNVSLF